MKKDLKIGIIGLGLIGGSIFKALYALKYDVSAVSKSIETLEKAKQYTKNVSPSLDALKSSDIIFVCTPMNKTLDILDELENIVNKNTIVADVSSLKSFLSNKKRPYIFIPTHPMAGTEFSGFDSSFETLFQGAKWVLTPFEETSPADVKTLSAIIEDLGSKPILSTPTEHDEAVALISHMPMLISQALFKTAEANKLAMRLASSGFKGMTRLALSNEEMAQDMVNLNSENIQKSLLSLYSSIGELLNDNYKEQISDIKKSRQSMYKDGKNIL